MTKATLSNYLWIPKDSVEGTPSEFAPQWEYEIELLNTPEGRLMQQQIAALRDEFGGDLDLEDLSTKDKMLIKNWSSVGDKWWALCNGDHKKISKLAKKLNLTVRDKRVESPWDDELASQLALVMPPREYQTEPFKKWLEAGHGIFHAAPAFGKTYIMIWLIMELKQKSLILVHTDALAEQFITRFRKGAPIGGDEESEETEFNPVTNCLELEEESGQQIIGRYRSPDKLYPVTVATWQSFISKTGKKALKQVSKEFGLVLCDECHVFAAPKAASVVNSFHAKRRSGVSATPTRKDQLDKALYDVLGPITSKGIARQLPITSTLIHTGVAYRKSGFPRKNEWSYILNALTKSAVRNDLIFEWAKHDAENGRNLLLLSDRRNWCLDMVDRLNKADIPAKFVVGGMNANQRDKIIQSMMNQEIQVICATQVFKLGVDIPILDTLYATCPMNNKELLEQMLGRIRRTYEGKKEPVIRYFVDEGHGMIYGCAKSTHKQLVELGSDIVLVEGGKRPEQVTFGDGYGSAAAEASLSNHRKRKSLKAAASKNSNAVQKLFNDLKEVNKQNDRFKRRMGTEK